MNYKQKYCLKQSAIFAIQIKRLKTNLISINPQKVNVVVKIKKLLFKPKTDQLAEVEKLKETITSKNYLMQQNYKQ